VDKRRTPIVVDCISYGFSQPTVVWYRHVFCCESCVFFLYILSYVVIHSGRKIAAVTQDDTAQVYQSSTSLGQYGTKTTLHLERPNLLDSGVYECRASNNVGGEKLHYISDLVIGEFYLFAEYIF